MTPEGGPVATALRTPQAEWVQGTRDRPCPDHWHHPLTAHRYEGLLVLLDGENWKVLDSVGLRVTRDGACVPLGDPRVAATPVEVVRRYPAGWTVTSRLVPHAGASGTLLEVTVRAPADGPGPSQAELRPIFDLRHMYDESAPEEVRAEAAPEGLHLARGRASVLCSIPGAHHRALRETLALDHPTGSGFRERVGDRVRFVAEPAIGLGLGTWSAELRPGEGLTMRLAVGTDRAAACALRDEAATSRAAAARARRWEEIREWAGPEPGLAERIFVMSECFGMPVSGTLLPEAGGWWFRTPWFRDVFEGLLGNWRTLHALGRSERVTDALKAAFRLQDPLTGRVPNRLPEHRRDQEVAERTGRLPDGYYHSADATLLAFTLLDELDFAPTDPGLRADADRAFERALAAFGTARPDTVDGPPVLTDEGLLMCVPWHTWTDGKRTVGPVADLPLRVPRAWQEEAIASGLAPAEVFRLNHQAAYYLPEINAQWLRSLHWASRHRIQEGDRAQAARMLERAIPAFRERFWDPARAEIANLVTREGRYDWTAGSPALVAIALLIPLPVFGRAERRGAWEAVADRLSVHHLGGLFGVLVKDSAERQYLGDEQYHEAVVWPRDTQWLWRLFTDLGLHPERVSLLEGALGHQQREGVLFYNHELFSLPDGSEDAEGRPTGHPLVPVKNPMQWWSQWCDPFLQRVDNLSSAPER